ncbi:MAG: flavodoxin [Eubacteriales bacterium]|nr:flavodoxin [Eubacteriales bacterium]
MRRAVVFYSLSGNTESAARMIADDIGADLIQIKMKKELPRSKWLRIVVGGRQATFGEKPQIEDLQLSDYDEIILGTPVWAGKVASPLNTLFARYRIADRVTAVFTLSGSGDNRKCEEMLRRILPNLKQVISLADGNSRMAEENEEKIRAFEQTICLTVPPKGV